MSAPVTQISVLAGRQFACVKIHGRANFTSSIDFNTVVTQLREKCYTYFVIELSECSVMDSTFLGVLAGFGLKMLNGSNGEADNRHVELLNPNERIKESLETVGALQLFRISQGPLAPPEKLEASALELAKHSRKELTRTCLEAHKTLMAMNPDNIARFKDVTKFLAEDLARLEDKN